MIYRRFIDFPKLETRNPFDELERMKHHMDRLLGNFAQRRAGRAGSGVFPPVNLTEDKNSYFVRAELPGVNVEDLDIQATVNTLSISGKRTIPVEDENAKYHRRERDAGKFSRMIKLPDAVDADAIEASLVNGLLTVKIPKSDMAKPRQIKVS